MLVQKMPTHAYVTGLLLLNAEWDLLSALSICLFVSYRMCGAVAYMHLGLWVREEDQLNENSAAVMAILLLQWGLIRFHGALAGPVSEATCVDVSVTYMMEALLVLVEVVAGNMHPWRGGFVVVSCVVCWLVIMGGCTRLY